MAKYKRATIGSIVKSKDPGKSDYIKFNLKMVGGSLTLKDGQTLSVETKSFQLKSLKDAVSSGKLSQEIAAKSEERINKMPEWVRADLVLVTKEDDTGIPF